jgi:hypothetical protein
MKNGIRSILMHRFLALAIVLAFPALAWADAFDHYTNVILAKAPKADGVQRVKQLTPDLLIDHNRVLADVKGAFLVVKTNEGRWAKLLVQGAAQKVGAKTFPILLIDRFVTFKEGEERAIAAEGKNVRLFPDFHFSLDLGQVVPAEVGGDLRLNVADDKTVIEPLGKAEIYLLTKPLPEAAPKKADKVVIGKTFEPKYFNGTYKLYDDGRRSGKLVLKVDDTGLVDGWYYSDKDGAKYEVTGKIGDPTHAIKFKITLPRTPEEFEGWMFTGDGRAICGVSRLQEREAGFYAVRVEEE